MLADIRRRPFSTTRDNLILDDETLIAEELGHYADAGGQTLVDCTAIGIGRDPAGLQRLARRTGLNIVMGTAFYSENAHPHYVRDMGVDDIAALMVLEVTEGVGPTKARAGVIGEVGLTGIPRGHGRKKVGPITPEEEKVLRAAGRAATRTGVAVSLHLDPVEPRAALVALDLLDEEGLDASRVIVGHLDQVQDLDYHRAIAGRGAYVQFDSFGREHYAEEWSYDFDFGHDSWRTRYLKRLIDEGYADQLLVSQDVALKSDLRAYGGNGYGHILMNIVPMLRELGVDDDAVRKLLVENPARALTVTDR
jgi:phosphotriesterase-related protein